MEHRLLGDTGISVSKICLGSMTWGEQNSEADAHQQLDYAVAHGVNFIDTAEMYPVPPCRETYATSARGSSNAANAMIWCWRAKSPVPLRPTAWKVISATVMIFPAPRFWPPAKPALAVCKPIIWIYTNCTGRSAKPISSAAWA